MSPFCAKLMSHVLHTALRGVCERVIVPYTLQTAMEGAL